MKKDAAKQQQEPAPKVRRSSVRPAASIEPLPDIAHARKIFYDFLDDKRPWATCQSAYEAMEAMVDAAAFAFRHDCRPTKEEVGEMQDWLMRFTERLDEHPEDYEGPCFCPECRSN